MAVSTVSVALTLTVTRSGRLNPIVCVTPRLSVISCTSSSPQHWIPAGFIVYRTPAILSASPPHTIGAMAFGGIPVAGSVSRVTFCRTSASSTPSMSSSAASIAAAEAPPGFETLQTYRSLSCASVSASRPPEVGSRLVTPVTPACGRTIREIAPAPTFPDAPGTTASISARARPPEMVVAVVVLNTIPVAVCTSNPSKICVPSAPENWIVPVARVAS